MTREQAALLLGVDSSATDEQINHAWRVWAKLAHPDAGGDRQHFEALTRARSVLLRRPPLAVVSPPASDKQSPPAARVPLRAVFRRPRARGVIAIAFALGVSILVLVLSSNLPAVSAAGAAGLAAGGWASIVQRAVLDRSADVGHRITLLTLAWLPMVTALVAGMAIRGVDMIGLLPVVVLPFVLVVALVNPGAGLWRPIRLPS